MHRNVNSISHLHIVTLDFFVRLNTLIAISIGYRTKVEITAVIIPTPIEFYFEVIGKTIQS